MLSYLVWFGNKCIICEQYFSGEDDKKGTFIMTDGYKKLDKEEIEQIFRESLKK